MAKRKSTKDKLRSTKHTHKTKARVTRTPLKIEGERRSPILYITILTEVLLNGVHMTIIYITILTEDSWNGIQMITIIIRLT
jgi:hypothetical protein